MHTLDFILENSIFKTRIRVWSGLMFMAVLALTGCQYQEAHPVEKEIIPVKEPPNFADEARQAFLQGDYPLAREKFDSLTKQGVDPETLNISLYGLTCVEMISTDDEDTFLQALESLLQLHTHIEDVPQENYELLIRALGHGSHLMGTRKQQTLGLISVLKVKNQKQSTQIHKLRKQVNTLKHQISSLESIDQELQEKRKK